MKLLNKCPVRTTLDLVGGKWKLLILFQLQEKPLRFSELKRKIPEISEKMLIQELKSLEINELLTRKNYGIVPPKVDYRLSEKGKHALPLLDSFTKFATAYDKTENDQY